MPIKVTGYRPKGSMMLFDTEQEAIDYELRIERAKKMYPFVHEALEGRNTYEVAEFIVNNK